MRARRWIGTALALTLVAVLGWVYYQSLVPAIHPDHDHGLENIAGGGFLRVQGMDGRQRNLVGRPGRVLILHWFELGTPTGVGDLPLLVDYAQSIAHDPDIEIVMIAINSTRESLASWAGEHGLPTARLYADPEGKTAGLIGVRRIPETLIYDPEGHLAHQARGPMNWSAPDVRAAIAGFKQGGEHQH